MFAIASASVLPLAKSTVPSALRYFTVTSATLLNLFTLRISTLFCMDRLWGKARQSSTLSDTFFHFSFRFLSSLDIAAWHRTCSQHIRCQPPHFFEIFLLDRVRDEVGGGYSQSLIQFYPILYNV